MARSWRHRVCTHKCEHVCTHVASDRRAPTAPSLAALPRARAVDKPPLNVEGEAIPRMVLSSSATAFRTDAAETGLDPAVGVVGAVGVGGTTILKEADAVDTATASAPSKEGGGAVDDGVAAREDISLASLHRLV